MARIQFNLTKNDITDYTRYLYVPDLEVTKSIVRSKNREYIVEKVIIPKSYYNVLKFYEEVNTIILKDRIEYRLGMVTLGRMNKNHYIIFPKSLHQEIKVGDHVDIVFDLYNAVFREDVKFV